MQVKDYNPATYRVLLVMESSSKQLDSALNELGYDVIDRLPRIDSVDKNKNRFNFDVAIIDSELLSRDIENSPNDLTGLNFPYITYTDDSGKNLKPRNAFSHIIIDNSPDGIKSSIEKAIANFRISQNNHWFPKTLDKLTNGIIFTDINGNITLMNSVIEKISGWNLREALGKNITKVFSITNLNANLFSDDPLLKAIIEKSEYESEGQFVFISRYGQETPINFIISPVYSNSKNLSGFVITISDLTEITKLQKALTEKEDSYISLITSSNNPIFIFQDSRPVFVNNAWAELFGYTRVQVFSGNFDLLRTIAPQDRFQAESLLLNPGKAENPGTSKQLHGISSDGRIIDLEVNYLEIIWEGRKAYQFIFRDITYKRHAEGIFRMFNLAVEQSPASIVITNTSGEIKYVNPKFTEKTGHTLKEVYGLNPQKIGWGETTADEFNRLWNSITNGKDWRGEFFNKRKDGSTYWDMASVSAIRNEDGEITHVIAVTEDITDMKLQREQLLIAKEKAEKSNKLKSEFIAQMSHEIRTPLNNILSSIWFLKQETEELLSDDMKEHYKIVDKNSQRLIRTIDLILNLSKIQSDNFEVKTELIDLDQNILEELVLEFYNKSIEKSIELVYEKDTANSNIVGDHFSLWQIFVNLLDNAFKYTVKGKIIIRLYNFSETEIAVDIEDTGIGISENYLPDIFSPFSQEDTSNTRNYEGAGLGLALVKNYADLNNAKIKVKSEKNVGSTFTVIFEKAE